MTRKIFSNTIVAHKPLEELRNISFIVEQIRYRTLTRHCAGRAHDPPTSSIPCQGSWQDMRDVGNSSGLRGRKRVIASASTFHFPYSIVGAGYAVSQYIAVSLQRFLCRISRQPVLSQPSFPSRCRISCQPARNAAGYGLSQYFFAGYGVSQYPKRAG